MNTKTKKGFTLTELIIVVVIIGILAAVLIPTLTACVKKAKISNDKQLVRNLNLALASDETTIERGGKHLHMQEALDAAFDAGYDVSKINATKADNEILWDSKHDVFCYLNDGSIEYIPASIPSGEELNATSDGHLLFQIVKLTSGDLTNNKFSVYAAPGSEVTAITTNKGFDAGTNTNITDISYTNSGSAKDVVIRTNLFSTRLEINGYVDPADATKGDTVTHYGYAGLVDVQKVAMSSYDECGVVGRLYATDTGATGHIHVKAGATVYQIEQLGGEATKVSVDSGATVYDINHEKVTEAISGTTDRFTETVNPDFTITETHSTGETITAQACVHKYTEDVIDGRHVYEVCKTCGYTVIKVDGVKKTVCTEDEDENVVNEIVPKASYDGSQVTASSDANGDVTIHTNDDGSYVTPSVAETPTVSEDYDTSCQHEWVHEHNGEQCITRCTKCNYELIQDHEYFDADTETFNSTCPTCGVTLGTEEVPWHVSNAAEFAAIDKVSYEKYTYFKQTKDITLTLNDGYGVYDYVRLSYDGCGHNLYAPDSASGACALFYNGYKKLEIKNVNLYSTKNFAMSYIYTVDKNSGDIDIINCTTNVKNNDVVSISEGNFGFFVKASVNKTGAGSLTIKNCTNNASISNAGNCISACIGQNLLVSDNTYKNYIVTIENFTNNGNIIGNTYAGLLKGNPSDTSYLQGNQIDQSTIENHLIVKNIVNNGLVTAKYAYLFSSGDYAGDNFFWNSVYATKVSGSGNIQHSSNAINNMEFAVTYDGNNYNVTGGSNDYTYKLIFKINAACTRYIDETHTSTISASGRDIVLDVSTETPYSSVLKTGSYIHAYDSNNVVEKGVLTSTEVAQLDYSYYCDGWNYAIMHKGDQTILIFDATQEDESDNFAYVDSTVNVYVYAYNNTSVFVGMKEIVQ